MQDVYYTLLFNGIILAMNNHFRMTTLPRTTSHVRQEESKDVVDLLVGLDLVKIK